MIARNSDEIGVLFRRRLESAMRIAATKRPTGAKHSIRFIQSIVIGKHAQNLILEDDLPANRVLSLLRIAVQ